MSAASPTKIELHHASFTDVLLVCRQKLAVMSAMQLAFISVLILLVMTGNAMQIIALNFWLRHFGNHKVGPFTTLAVSSAVFPLFFFVLLVAYIIKNKPNCKFIWTARSLKLLFWIGFWDAVNSAMVIYAALYTPEVLQALFTTLQSVYTIGLTKVVLKDQRSYVNKWVITSVVLSIVGVGIASITDFTDTNTESGSKKWWSLVYFLAIPLLAFYNVLQAKYMKDFTLPESYAQKVALNSSPAAALEGGDEQLYGTAGGEATVDDDNIVNTHGEDGIVKFVMLFGDTFIQLVLILFLLPADALPWWGGSKSVPKAWDNLVEGLACLFNCHLNMVFCILYSGGYVLSYIGSAYLNHYSATLCSMIGQLSSPVTALLLIIVPSWNLEQGSTPWYLSVIAIVVLTIGTILYSIWEEMTELDEEEEKHHGEKTALLPAS